MNNVRARPAVRAYVNFTNFKLQKLQCMTSFAYNCRISQHTHASLQYPVHCCAKLIYFLV